MDITNRGARVNLAFGNLEPGSKVTMDIRGRTHAAQVVWNTEGTAGLQFEETLPIDTLAAINRSMHRAAQGPKRRFLMN